MAALTFDPTTWLPTIRIRGLAHDNPTVRQEAGGVETATKSATVTGADATLTKAGGAAWLTVPASSTNGVPFDVTADVTGLRAGVHVETVTATADGFDPADLVVSVNVIPTGAAPKAAARR